MAGAEIINGDFNLMAAQPVELAHRPFGINHSPLSDFKHNLKCIFRQSLNEV